MSWRAIVACPIVTGSVLKVLARWIRAVLPAMLVCTTMRMVCPPVTFDSAAGPAVARAVPQVRVHAPLEAWPAAADDLTGACCPAAAGGLVGEGRPTAVDAPAGEGCPAVTDGSVDEGCASGAVDCVGEGTASGADGPAGDGCAAAWLGTPKANSAVDIPAVCMPTIAARTRVLRRSRGLRWVPMNRSPFAG
ncbi:hypothetical protein GCM10010394_55060 [Streptomyces crystallinus]|uniref:Secreted protein n=1 Tax=Streptomyces crystallinus TaxID=68191 RepID=A0ABN1GS21_9ACTN